MDGKNCIGCVRMHSFLNYFSLGTEKPGNGAELVVLKEIILHLLNLISKEQKFESIKLKEMI